MKLRIETKLDFFVIEEIEALDPITVILKGEIGSGKLLVECYGESWSTYFGGTGDKTLLQFISGINSEYLGNRLISNTFHRPTKREQTYVNRISQAVIDACKLKRGV